MSREIKATLGYSAIVDDADYDLLSQFRWYAHNGGSNGRSEKRPARRTGASEGRKVLFLVHHLVRAPKGMVVDHINGNPWDNRRENLRICTHAQNLKNRRTRKVRPGLFKGVYPHGDGFRATIRSDGDSFCLGCHPSSELAALAYDAAALALHGEYASLNFPDAKTEAVNPNDVRLSRSVENEAVATAVADMFRNGFNALQISAALSIPANRARRIASEQGITLRRGRPHKSTAALPSPSVASQHAGAI